MNASVRNGKRVAIKTGKNKLQQRKKLVYSQQPACRKEDTDPEIIILGNRIKRIKIAAITLLFFLQLSYHIMFFVHCLNYFVSYILHVLIQI